MEVLGGWDSVDKNVDIALYIEDEDDAVEGKDLYNQMNPSEEC